MIVSLPIEIVVPIRTVTESNTKGHWRTKARRAKDQRTTMRLVLDANFSVPPLPVTVTFTRLGSGRYVDDDNLPSCSKHLRDSIAEWLGIDDGGPHATWKYAQERTAQGVFGVKIRIEART